MPFAGGPIEVSLPRAKWTTRIDDALGTNNNTGFVLIPNSVEGQGRPGPAPSRHRRLGRRLDRAARVEHGSRVPLLLDLVRHGAAAAHHDLGDSHRPLTTAGERAVVRQGEALAARAERPSRIFCSPLLRARQTASLLARALGFQGAIEQLDELEPESDPGLLLGALARHEVTTGHALLVGHQPLIGRLVAGLAGVANASIAPGSVARIELPDRAGPRRGRLAFLLVPEPR